MFQNNCMTIVIWEEFYICIKPNKPDYLQQMLFKKENGLLLLLLLLTISIN